MNSFSGLDFENEDRYRRIVSIKECSDEKSDKSTILGKPKLLNEINYYLTQLPRTRIIFARYLLAPTLSVIRRRQIIHRAG